MTRGIDIERMNRDLVTGAIMILNQRGQKVVELADADEPKYVFIRYTGDQFVAVRLSSFVKSFTFLRISRGDVKDYITAPITPIAKTS